MDEATGSALFDQCMTKCTEALAIEVVTLRAWYGSLATAMDQLTTHIDQLFNEEGASALSMARCAGGMAAVQLLREWTDESMGAINDFIVTMAEVE